jgi:formate hydrogenlyase subunit 6/NADH:ubiquinone oxidoreductase subunit I
MDKKPVFKYELCMACGICIDACPISILGLTDISIDKYKKAYPVQLKGSKCIGCKMCKFECPVKAVDVIN